MTMVIESTASSDFQTRMQFLRIQQRLLDLINELDDSDSESRSLLKDAVNQVQKSKAVWDKKKEV
jgi:hypothetical protein